MTSNSAMQQIIEKSWENRGTITWAHDEARSAVADALELLDRGQLRIAEKTSHEWTVNPWLKKALLLSSTLCGMELTTSRLFENLRPPNSRTLYAHLASSSCLPVHWRVDYNEERPHTSLDGLTPNEFSSRSNEDHNQNGVYL